LPVSKTPLFFAIILKKNARLYAYAEIIAISNRLGRLPNRHGSLFYRFGKLSNRFGKLSSWFEMAMIGFFFGVIASSGTLKSAYRAKSTFLTLYGLPRPILYLSFRRMKKTFGNPQKPFFSLPSF
jgi:hypothetical protein